MCVGWLRKALVIVFLHWRLTPGEQDLRSTAKGRIPGYVGVPQVCRKRLIYNFLKRNQKIPRESANRSSYRLCERLKKRKPRVEISTQFSHLREARRICTQQAGTVPTSSCKLSGAGVSSEVAKFAAEAKLFRKVTKNTS